MRITSIQPQKKRAGRVSVFLDEKFWVGMSSELLLDLGINKNDLIDEEVKAEIEDKVVKDGALNYALRVLTGRQLSVHKMKEKLETREYGEEVIDQVIEKCHELYLLDDEQLCRAIVESRRDNFQGQSKILQKLNEIGIDKFLAKSTVEECFENVDEIELAKKSLYNKYRDKKLDRREQQRATNFLNTCRFFFRSCSGGCWRCFFRYRSRSRI